MYINVVVLLGRLDSRLTNPHVHVHSSQTIKTAPPPPLHQSPDPGGEAELLTPAPSSSLPPLPSSAPQPPDQWPIDGAEPAWREAEGALYSDRLVALLREVRQLAALGLSVPAKIQSTANTVQKFYQHGVVP